MKKILLLVLIITYFKSNAQSFTKEGEEIEIQRKYTWINYIGTIDDNAYYFEFKSNKTAEIILQFNHLNQKDLKPGIPTDISLELNKDLITRDYLTTNVYLKNKHIYILYSLIDTKASGAGYVTFIKTLDENFKEISTVKLNPGSATGVRYSGELDVVFSTDEKKALLILSHMSTKITADRLYINDQKKTEVVWFDTDKNTIDGSLFFGKDAPELKTFYENFSIANNGNIAFTIEEYQLNMRARLSLASIGLVKYQTTDILAHEIKLNQTDSTFHQRVYALNNGNTVHLALTKTRYMYTYINMQECKIETEKTQAIKSWKLPEDYNTSSMMLGMLNNTQQDIYMTIEHITHKIKDMNNDVVNEKKLGILKFNLKGDFIWMKTIDRQPQYNKFPVYYYSFMQNYDKEKDYVMLLHDNNVNIITREELATTESNYKTGFPSNTILHKINENGDVKKTVIYENLKESGIIPSSSTLLFKDGQILFNVMSLKKIKFVTAKL
jgi:hypothetical protein